MAPDAPQPAVKYLPPPHGQNVATVLDEYENKNIIIPDFQRDSDQWDHAKKSLFIESVLNNLNVPAFFFAFKEDDQTVSEVVDGQQRLTILWEFYKKKFRLATSESADYLPGSSVYYAGKTFEEIPRSFQSAFKSYTLPIIQLPDLPKATDRSLRLEVFRRINQAGTPLTPQDLRLAYYGDCDTVAYIRICGVYDPLRQGAQRMLDSAKAKYKLNWPWKSASEQASEEWSYWWSDKELAIGQTASEMFLWFVIAKRLEGVKAILSNENHIITQLKYRFSGRVDEVADIVCAQFHWESNQRTKILPNPRELKRLFSEFAEWFQVLRVRIPSATQLQKYRRIALLMAGLADTKLKAKGLSEFQRNEIESFLTTAGEWSKKQGIQVPASKGKWTGSKGMEKQIESYRQVAKIISEQS
jgi:hypothetical protein